ncbi:MAG: hypothetical protein COA79_17120 [Planctomycetota bacterium]|nr:MAG: hypothetical protein COA79_17120 [Planctomycetota bacterium]
MIPQFDHLGLAVKHPKKAQDFLSLLGYHFTEPTFDELQKVSIIMATNKYQPDIEIIFSDDENSPIKNILKSNDQLIYHLCYKAEEPQLFIKNLKLNKVKVTCISSPKKAIVFQNKKVSFYFVDGFGVIEIIHLSS